MLTAPVHSLWVVSQCQDTRDGNLPGDVTPELSLAEMQTSKAPGGLCQVIKIKTRQNSPGSLAC